MLFSLHNNLKIEKKTHNQKLENILSISVEVFFIWFPFPISKFTPISLSFYSRFCKLYEKNAKNVNHVKNDNVNRQQKNIDKTR